MMRPTLLATSLLLVPGNWAGAAPPAKVAPAEPEAVALEIFVAPGPNLVVVFTVPQGSHLYWKNPGDAGLAPEVRWTLPAGWTAGPLAHPVPEAHPDGLGLDYVHRGRVALVAPLRGSGKPVGAFHAEVDWLVCREGCEPGQATRSGRLEDPALQLDPATWAQVQGALPGAAEPGLLAGPARLERGPGRWWLRVPLAGGMGPVAFYPERPEGFSIPHREVRATPAEVGVPLVPDHPGARLRLLKGVLRLGGRAVALEIPVPQEAP